MIPLLAAFLLEANGELMEKTPGDTPAYSHRFWPANRINLAGEAHGFGHPVAFNLAGQSH